MKMYFFLTWSWVGGQGLLVGAVAVGGELNNPYLNSSLIFLASVRQRWVLLERVPSFLPCGMDKRNKGLVPWKGAVSSWKTIDRKEGAVFKVWRSYITRYRHEVNNKCQQMSPKHCFMLCICKVVFSPLLSIQRERQANQFYIIESWGFGRINLTRVACILNEGTKCITLPCTQKAGNYKHAGKSVSQSEFFYHIFKHLDQRHSEISNFGCNCFGYQVQWCRVEKCSCNYCIVVSKRLKVKNSCVLPPQKGTKR